jgi:SAM-dependent methyltransferase
VTGTLIKTIKELPGVRLLRLSAITTEARWYDWRHNVQTRADPFEDLRDWSAGYPYLPIRPSAARRVLRSLRIPNHSDYTFVDLGSGKGRMLLIASEFRFRRVVGVEMRDDLHAQALENVQRFRHTNAQRSEIECALVDATRYDFPAGNLVVYLFNPFGSQVVENVFRRLDATFEQQPRDIFIVYVYPESGFLLDTMRHFEKYAETERYRISKSRYQELAADPTPTTPVPLEHT